MGAEREVPYYTQCGYLHIDLYNGGSVLSIRVHRANASHLPPGYAFSNILQPAMYITDLLNLCYSRCITALICDGNDFGNE
ncbi:hypothetical protein KIN20_013263 [Parelaphostrongylus tenuis]|uniref:Uncharacterized protein n=1 Tax=Parelaphostrongylus tenuis TaxID=148309 RepID=A0AAD5QQV7_PARTN|nr:hypothetical protein KIN20_013263 [Parelaphostrongylus tenuis]